MKKAVEVIPKSNNVMLVSFQDGENVLYDMKPLFEIVPSFRELKKNEDLFRAAKISEKGDVIFWNDTLSVDANNVWENGVHVVCSKRKDSKHILAYAIQLARQQHSLTQKNLAEITGISQADISKLERGIGNPSISTLERLAKGLGKELVIELRDPEGMHLEKEEMKHMSNDNETVYTHRHKTLEERAAEYGGKLNLAGEYDRGEPVGREVW